MINLKAIKGFTLVELAIVLVIVGVLVGSFITTFTARIENIRIAETEDELEQIKTAIIGYTYTNGHLPCPDCISPLCALPTAGFRDGIEDRGTGGAADGACGTGNSVGTIPWVTLGLGRGDQWGTRYRYWVDTVYSFDDPALPNDTFTLVSGAGVGIIQEPDYATDPTGATMMNLATNVVAVIYSHGKNGLGGYSLDGTIRPAIPAANVDELDNTNNDTDFIRRPPTTDEATTAGGEFDDIVDWISEFELKAKMVEAGQLP